MKKELKNILVPVDFKDPSLRAVNYAYNLAHDLKSNIILLHVLQTPGIIADFFKRSDHLVKLTDKIKDKLAFIIKSHDLNGKQITITSSIETGKPYEKILKKSAEQNVRMIILGENHQGDEANKALGSTVYHVTLKSPVPVLTLKGKIENMKHRIVVPLDLTSQMRRQLFSAIVYGMNYGSKIYLVSALIGGIKMKNSRIYKKLKLAKKTIKDNGIECIAKLFPRDKEPPYRKVIRYAKDVDAGMILLMTHKEGYTYDNYIGAFAHHIINESQVPILSLTAGATNIDFGKYIKNFIEPLGLLSED